MSSPSAVPAYPRAVLFDLLTALLDSWTVWNRAAGSEAAGRAWRAEYLRRTYGCGAYQPYERLVQEAATAVGLPAAAPAALEACWDELPAWDGARELLSALRPHCRLAVVTNCSARLGRRAADLLGVDWDVVVTSEEAGFYKPDPRPYALALSQLRVEPSQAAFVAGSGYDMFGTSKVGLRTYWHNRIGLTLPEGAPRPEVESARLDAALPWLQRFG
ncbi:HAD family hydrolase [Achromobacter insolitus]|uniref:(S)-2-haloacid dehalogenase 4A n=1 Tax=Achromobacter insolitus TaxID=217204 RepID=A0A6S7F7H8_9BURK|nr:HAD-IA family hydrolase [Achromobacter insolitus]APX77152.1 haloacid dehalogenase [Achromobacter insolitus]MCP1405557.1 2-haloalkanoic acid dehalogenase type II [Achromobacter insolitus]OWT65320.1 haloacid dehalogenase [Achromobacter insolitus]CAB3727216.1 (S)-2-haloacid dehalogenase 4A [Achromobacter insolitus]CAB3937254.1 (S)-2-haloacid dehalogenase 4A [Achromobacter insolitus]